MCKKNNYIALLALLLVIVAIPLFHWRGWLSTRTRSLRIFPEDWS